MCLVDQPVVSLFHPFVPQRCLQLPRARHLLLLQERRQRLRRRARRARQQKIREAPRAFVVAQRRAARGDLAPPVRADRLGGVGDRAHLHAAPVVPLGGGRGVPGRRRHAHHRVHREGRHRGARGPEHHGLADPPQPRQRGLARGFRVAVELARTRLEPRRALRGAPVGDAAVRTGRVPPPHIGPVGRLGRADAGLDETRLQVAGIARRHRRGNALCRVRR